MMQYLEILTDVSIEYLVIFSDCHIEKDRYTRSEKLVFSAYIYHKCSHLIYSVYVTYTVEFQE